MHRKGEAEGRGLAGLFGGIGGDLGLDLGKTDFGGLRQPAEEVIGRARLAKAGDSADPLADDLAEDLLRQAEGEGGGGDAGAVSHRLDGRDLGGGQEPCGSGHGENSLLIDLRLIASAKIPYF
ncbi:MAG: hypothetical protein VYD87_10965 [Pseudomonadota bacterium]|nr:hypothetical protein [Pseudomonadota bacterium]MEE3101986.1 hypothetical protein [Pseudomonadota bacterium]